MNNFIGINRHVSLPISIPIPIPIPIPNENTSKPNSPNKETTNQYLEYTLESNIIDPSNSPPVCDFIHKLHSRLELYGCYKSSNSLDRV